MNVNFNTKIYKILYNVCPGEQITRYTHLKDAFFFQLEQVIVIFSNFRK